jgi:exopolysaccharide biosynthesis WecB/TagA/CpsF family protein
MAIPYPLDDYDLEAFLKVAENYGQAPFGYVVTPNVDHTIRFHDDAQFRALYADASYVLLDSRFLAKILRLTKGLKLQVCTGSDLTARLLQDLTRPEDGIVLIGASAEQAAMVAEKYGLKSLHHYNPPMGFIRDPKEVEACVRFVESHSPFRYCFIAVGSPQQEKLAQAVKARGTAFGLGLCIGASIDFLTGVERRAPVWLQRLGIEWTYRLIQSPRRLAKRYLIRGPRVFALLRDTEVIVRKTAIAPPGQGSNR